MYLAFLPLIAVAVIALAWISYSKRSRQDPGASVAQFNRALTALAPRELDEVPAPRN